MVDGIMDGLLEIAKTLRAQKKYSEEEFINICIVLGPKETGIIVTPWHNDAEKRAMMKMVSDKAREQKATVVGVVSDTRWTDAKKLCSYFNVPEPKGAEDFEAFKNWYHSLLRLHGGEIRNLPREVWSEAVMVAAKGPQIKTTAVFAPYVEGPNDTVLYTAKNSNSPDGDIEAHTFQLGLIPDWWTQ